MAPLKPERNGRIIDFVQLMGLIFLSGFMPLYRRMKINPKRKSFVFINNQLKGNPLETMKVVLTSTECSDTARHLPDGVSGRKPARQLQHR
jgi:hypothetical protein